MNNALVDSFKELQYFNRLIFNNQMHVEKKIENGKYTKLN